MYARTILYICVYVSLRYQTTNFKRYTLRGNEGATFTLYSANYLVN